MFVRVCAMSLALALTTFAVDLTGTWKFNAQKSKYTGAPKPKEATVTYTKQGTGWTYELRGSYPDGKPIASSFTYVKDGVDIPLKGSILADAVNFTNGGGDVTMGVFKRGGKAVGQVKRTVSKDGKTMTLEGATVLADGTKATYTAIYER